MDILISTNLCYLFSVISTSLCLSDFINKSFWNLWMSLFCLCINSVFVWNMTSVRVPRCECISWRLDFLYLISSHCISVCWMNKEVCIVCWFMRYVWTKDCLILNLTVTLCEMCVQIGVNSLKIENELMLNAARIMRLFHCVFVIIIVVITGM